MGIIIVPPAMACPELVIVRHLAWSKPPLTEFLVSEHTGEVSSAREGETLLHPVGPSQPVISCTELGSHAENKV